jgi:hypothetical protein
LRPPLGRGRCSGSSGWITAHRSSVTKGLAIAMSSVTPFRLIRSEYHDKIRLPVNRFVRRS